ncbi:hypothetical protein ACIPSA_43270 [Streptomyces sp. NPDC086549]|uniref:hypothetical protein n=1 Tax=Streptomyces sp. NPDC086549 TaxID=3365752 RepID=UPI0038001BD1
MRLRHGGHRITALTAQLAGEGPLELSLDGGPVLASLILDTPTADAYTTVVAGLVTEGVHDVRLGLRGPLRLAHVGWCRAPSTRQRLPLQVWRLLSTLEVSRKIL